MFRKKITFFFILFFPLMLSLGVWQWQRGNDKKLREHVLQQQLEQAPMTLPQLMAPSFTLSHANDVKRVTLSGYYQYQQSLLLDNRTYNGKPGYVVFTPFYTVDDNDVQHIFLINRGWFAARSDRVTPDVQQISDSRLATITGLVYQPEHAKVWSDDVVSQGWPKVVQSIDVATLAQIQNDLKITLFEYPIVLNPDAIGALTPHWRQQGMTAEKHYGYAFQWFAMALALLVLFVVSLRSGGSNK